MNQAKKLPPVSAAIEGAPGRSVVFAGPSSTITIPGIVVSEIVDAMALTNPIIRIRVDGPTDYDSGLFRAPSMATAMRSESNVLRVHEAPTSSRYGTFVGWIPGDALVAIAFVWPGIDSSWVAPFIAAAKFSGVRTSVVCVSVPKSTSAGIERLAELVAEADSVLVGSETDARTLSSDSRASGPVVRTHQALSMDRHEGVSRVAEIIAFLPRDDASSLSTLMTAFDAIPDAWIDRYRVKVVMRFTDVAVPDVVTDSYHSDFVTVVSEDVSSEDLRTMVAASSALIIADPALDSRAFSTAIGCGLPVVVMTSTELPEVGRGYAGAFLAEASRSASVYVALTHSLRLAELKFPRPDELRGLVDELLHKDRVRTTSPTVAESSLLP